MLAISSEQLNAWMVTLLWPAARILALISVAPLFGHVAVPARIKVGLGLLLAVAIAPGLPALPAVAPFSASGVLLLMQQILTGLALGFTMRLVFAAVALAGELAALTMGLSFASFYDPSSSSTTSVLSQWFGWLALMVFISSNLHLALLASLAASFDSLPVAALPMGSGPFRLVTLYGSQIFATGLQLALPILAALLVTHLALGILTKAAPQLNLVTIGFPVTLGVGLLMTGVALPYLTQPMLHALGQALAQTNLLLR